MDSETELTTFKPRLRPKSAKSKPKPLKNNRISSPEIESITESGTSDQPSSNPEIFLARSKPHMKRTTKLISEDEISNISTLDDQTETEFSDNLHRQPKFKARELKDNSSKASDSKSYRDKIKERFRSVKQQSSQSLEKSSLKKFKNRSQDILNLNKCIDNLRNDNHNVNLQLKAHKSYVYQGVGGEVSSAEKYQFFCESSPEIDTINEGIDKKDREDLIIEKRAENIKELLRNSYEECVWFPQNGTLTHEFENTGTDLSAEGLFVAKPPKIPQRHLTMLKQRLLSSENKEFFDRAGNIKFDETNYSQISYRPDRFDEDSPFELIYQKPSTNVPTNMSSIIINETKPTLEINIQGFRFINHPLFSKEHKLQEDLIRHFDVHKEFRRRKKREKLWDRLQTLRKTKSTLEEAEAAAGDAPAEDLAASNAQILKQIKNIRGEFYEECKLYRDNAKHVLNAWKVLKNLRNENGYSTTTIKLVISKHSNENQFFDDPDVILNELIAEKDEEYQEKLSNYKKELQSWKKQVEDENDESIIEEKPIKPPRTVSANKLRLVVENLIQESFGDATEPTISFSVNYTNLITASDEVNDEEKSRRKAVENSKLRLKLTLKNLLICKSKACKLNPNFTLNFDEVLSLKLRDYENIQDNIDIQLVEEQNLRLTNNVLCSAKIPIPKLQQLIGQTKFQEVLLTQNEQNERNQPKNVNGFLTFCIGWDSPPKLKQKSKNILNLQGGLNAENLQEWIDTTNPDPEDPRNAVIFKYLKENKNENVAIKQDTKYFRCDPYLETFAICSKEDIDNNVRLQLLKLRDQNEPEFVGMMVPSRLNEIPSNIFATYKRRLADEKYQEYFDKEDEIDDDIIAKRSLGRKYLRQIHTKVFQICRNCENNLSFEDIIDEKMVTWIQNYLKTMLSNFLNWFKLRPALSKPLPLLEMQSEVECLNSKLDNGLIFGGKANIVIHLRSGINLPVASEIEKANSGRRRSKTTGGNKESRKGAENESKSTKSQYFVEVSIENSRIRSKSSQGNKTITWDETLRIPLESENLDYLNPNSLKGAIYINLFQEIGEGSEENKEVDVVFLGSVVISVAAAASDPKLDGEFALKMPPYIYGYEKEEETRSPSTPRTQTYKNFNQNLSYLEMTVYIDSTVPKISADLGSISCGEPPYIRDHILDWNKRFNEDHPKRKFSALAIDSNGKTICLTRFIKPLEPPKLNTDEFDVTLEQCARFVSLIPFNHVNKFYENIWLAGEQILKLGIGTIYDHATLLTCYLSSLKIEAWLLLGFGIPHGNTAYILIREYNETPLPNHFIIDVTSGIMYNVTDQYCPLKKVYCVVNENNIWANVQRGDAVFTTRFDFTRRFDWQPLFNNSVSSPSNSVQHNLYYLQSGDPSKLQNVIEKKLHKKIARIREQDVTIWNHYLSNLLKGQIYKAEKNFMHSKTFLGATSQIVEYSESFKINGTIQCLHFSSVNEIVDEIVRTKSWNVSGGNVEFASCVQVHAYVNQVIAVWIAFVSVVRK